MGAISLVDLEGVAILESGKEPASTTAPGYQFDDLDAVSVLRLGAIYVVTEDACDENDAVYMRITAAGAEEAGSFRSDSDGGDAVQVDGLRFRKSSGVAGFNVLEVSP
jgi:hypothetical protein